jgi:antitoxin component YwqK of YwqJK toxin-antitoxin module
MIQSNTIDNVEVEIRQFYYQSGALLAEAPYVEGKRHGIEKGYYESGALRWESPYVNGKMQGIEKYYDADKTNIICLLLYDKDRKVASIKI